MSSKKQISTKVIEFGEDDPHFMPSPCFQLSSNVELKDIPTNGEEYLLKVMKERSNYSEISVSNINLKRYANKHTVVCENSTDSSTPNKMKPTIEWQNIQVADFSDVRMHVKRMLAKRSELPKDLQNETLKNITDWKDLIENSEPVLSSVVELSQAVVDEGLEVITSMLEEIQPGTSIDHRMGQWIYTLLAVTKYPHLSDTTSKLRSLSRQCAEIRSNIDPDSENGPDAIAPLNIFICLIGRYFGQFDLAD